MLMRAAADCARARALSTVTAYARDAKLLPGERVSWPKSPPEPAPITMLSHGILGGNGDRPVLAAPLRRTMNINQLDGTPSLAAT